MGQAIHTHGIHTALTVFSPIPPARRMQSAFDEDNLVRTGCMTTSMLLNLANDTREMSLAIDEFKRIKDIKGVVSNPMNAYQHNFSFFRGTCLEPITNKYDWLRKADKSLYETRACVKLRDVFGIEKDDKTKRLIKTFNNKIMVDAYTHTGNKVKTTLTRASQRISVLGLYASALFELPALIKSAQVQGSTADKAKSIVKQAIKSAGYVGIVNACIGIAGAVFAPYGIIASLIGMAIGSTIGLKASHKVNEQIDNIFANNHPK